MNDKSLLVAYLLKNDIIYGLTYGQNIDAAAAPSQEGAELALVVFDTFGSCSLRNELQSYLLPSFFLFICCTARQSLIFVYLCTYYTYTYTYYKIIFISKTSEL